MLQQRTLEAAAMLMLSLAAGCAASAQADTAPPSWEYLISSGRWDDGNLSTGKVVNGLRVSAFTSTFHHRAWSQEQLNSNGKSASDR
jgi:hypothetical protein